MSTVPDQRSEAADRLGPEAAQALYEWAELNDRKVRLFRPSWLPPGKGYTGAVLAALEVAPPPRIVILKVLPEGPHRTEPARHSRALRESPRTFAQEHLVEQAFEPCPLRGGGALMFQAVAGDGLRDARPLGALEGEEFTRTCAHVVRGLLTEWNTARTLPRRMPASAYVRGEVDPEGGGLRSLEPWRRGAGLAGSSQPWFDAGDRLLPNPYLLLSGGHPELADPEVPVLTGLTHGDLHVDNVIVPVRRGAPQEAAYRLIDLGTFRTDGALTCDIAMLLLSALAPFVSGALPARQEQALRDHIVAPRPEHTDRLPAELVRRVDCVRDTADGLMAGWREPWADQFLLSLVAGALRYTTFTGLGDRARGWYLLLAAQACAAVLEAHTGAPPAPHRPGPRPHEPSPQPYEPSPPDPVSPPDPAPAARPATCPDPREALVEALEALPAMNDKDAREALLRGLPRTLRTSIPRSSILRVEVLGLVDTCLTFPDGLRELREAIRTVDTGTRERGVVFGLLEAMPEFGP
ncbi:effector-associated domain 2-containing protein [Streptomyces alanosinicus]|uniref:Effector-associated domain-containing protein n=1 Tax=Streptomyces alanosinicus TaxID=68171 RepID=A0A918YFB9_9ACTN|nr:hypothetical protein [Streptomyces alanosinicus]GHE01181.1 hypothetical protein GCM10010339_19360 [Streptomyces alanosinicus]